MSVQSFQFMPFSFLFMSLSVIHLIKSNDSNDDDSDDDAEDIDVDALMTSYRIQVNWYFVDQLEHKLGNI